MRHWLKRFGFAVCAVSFGFLGWFFVRPILASCPTPQYVGSCIDQHENIPSEMIQLFSLLEASNYRDRDLVRPIFRSDSDFGHTMAQFRLQGIWSVYPQIYEAQDVFRFFLGRGEYAGGTWGIDAAANEYFHKSAHELSAHEQIFLLTAYLNPDFHNPYLHPEEFQRSYTFVSRLADRYNIFERKTHSVILSSEDWLNQYYTTDFFMIKNEGARSTMPHTFDIHSEIDSFLRQFDSSALKNTHILVGNIETGKMEALVSNDISAIFARANPKDMIRPFVYAEAFAQGMYPQTTIAIDQFLIEGKEDLMYDDRSFLYEADTSYDITLATGFAQKDTSVLVQLIDFIGIESVPDLFAQYGLRDSFRPLFSGDGKYQDGVANFFQIFKGFSLLAADGEYFEYTWSEDSSFQDWYGEDSENLLSIESVAQVVPSWSTQMLDSLMDESKDGSFLRYSGTFGKEGWHMRFAYNDQYVIGILLPEEETVFAARLEESFFDSFAEKASSSQYASHGFTKLDFCWDKTCEKVFFPPVGTPLVVSLTPDRIKYENAPDMIEEDRFRMEYLVEYMDDTTTQNEHF
jgi:hypothetical protein